MEMDLNRARNRRILFVSFGPQNWKCIYDDAGILLSKWSKDFALQRIFWERIVFPRIMKLEWKKAFFEFWKIFNNDRRVVGYILNINVII